ncbi:hypothetical protein Ancab_017575 [Ancistrocladus abbreviatus]
MEKQGKLDLALEEVEMIHHPVWRSSVGIGAKRGNRSYKEAVATYKLDEVDKSSLGKKARKHMLMGCCKSRPSSRTLKVYTNAMLEKLTPSIRSTNYRISSVWKGITGVLSGRWVVRR